VVKKELYFNGNPDHVTWLQLG